MKILDKIKKIPGGLKFLLIVVLFYVVFAMFDFNSAKLAFLSFWATFAGILKILLIVFFVMFLVNLFVKPEAIKKHLGKDSGAKGWFYTIVGSILISGPPYILFPLLGDLRKHGMKDSLLVVFMNNRNVQPVFLPVMIFYFGLHFTIVISVYILLFSLINGAVAGRLLEKKIN